MVPLGRFEGSLLSSWLCAELLSLPACVVLDTQAKPSTGIPDKMLLEARSRVCFPLHYLNYGLRSVNHCRQIRTCVCLSLPLRNQMTSALGLPHMSSNFYFPLAFRRNLWISSQASPRHWGFPSGSAVKNLPARQEPQETWVQSLGGEDPLEEGMATHSSVLPWRIPWAEEPGGLESMGLQRVRHD